MAREGATVAARIYGTAETMPWQYRKADYKTASFACNYTGSKDASARALFGRPLQRAARRGVEVFEPDAAAFFQTLPRGFNPGQESGVILQLVFKPAGSHGMFLYAVGFYGNTNSQRPTAQKSCRGYHLRKRTRGAVVKPCETNLSG